MDSLTFTINLKDLNDPDNEDELKSIIGDMQLLIKFLMNANPNYYLIGNMLNEQLDEQMKQVKEETVDPRTPKEKMQEKFCDIFDEASLGHTAWDMNERHGDEPCPGYWDAWDNFLHQIGEAMGPVCYAGYKLKMKFIEAGQYADWVDECIDYYEKNWKF